MWGGFLGERVWLFEWRRELFVREKELLQNLLLRLEGVILGVNPDCWVWKSEEGGIFSIRSCYKILQSLCLEEGGVSRDEEVVFRDMWKSRAPSKVLAFSWLLFIDRISTKIDLAKKMILSMEDSKRCVFCGLFDESVEHLFPHSNVISKVWREVMDWVQFHFLIPPNLIIHFMCWSSEMRTKKLRKGAWIIWHAVI